MGHPVIYRADEFWEQLELMVQKKITLYIDVFGNRNKLVAHEGLTRIGLYDIIEWMAQNSIKIPLVANLDYSRYNPNAVGPAIKVNSMLKDSGLDYAIFSANRYALLEMAQKYPEVETGLTCQDVDVIDIKTADVINDAKLLGFKHYVVGSNQDHAIMLCGLNDDLAKHQIKLWVMTDGLISWARLLNKNGIGVISFCPENVS